MLGTSLVLSRPAPTPSSLAHEGNVERVNSAAKLAADPNLDAERLSRRVYIAQNIDTYPFSEEQVKERYIQKFGSVFLRVSQLLWIKTVLKLIVCRDHCSV